MVNPFINFINAGKQFDLQLYPRKTHSIAGPQARVHLFTCIRDHFRDERLGMDTAPASGSPSGTAP